MFAIPINQATIIKKIDMLYKCKDKVRLKRDIEWSSGLVDLINELPNRVATISKIEINDNNVHYYCMEEIGMGWPESDIECLVEEYIVPSVDPIKNRFEILDL